MENHNHEFQGVRGMRGEGVSNLNSYMVPHFSWTPLKNIVITCVHPKLCVRLWIEFFSDLCACSSSHNAFFRFSTNVVLSSNSSYAKFRDMRFMLSDLF